MNHWSYNVLYASESLAAASPLFVPVPVYSMREQVVLMVAGVHDTAR